MGILSAVTMLDLQNPADRDGCLQLVPKYIEQYHRRNRLWKLNIMYSEKVKSSFHEFISAYGFNCRQWLEPVVEVEETCDESDGDEKDGGVC